MTLHLYDFWRHILRRATKGVRAFRRQQPLNEAKVGQLDESVVANEHVLWFQVSVNQVLTVHELECLKHLRYVEASTSTIELSELIDDFEQFAILDVVNEHVDVASVLLDSLELEDERVLYRIHVLDLLPHVVLLLGVDHLVFRNHLYCEDFAFFVLFVFIFS